MRAMVEAEVRRVAGVGGGTVSGSRNGPAPERQSTQETNVQNGVSASTLYSSSGQYVPRNAARGRRWSVKTASVRDISVENHQIATPDKNVLPPGFQRIVDEALSQEGIDAARARALADAQELANRQKRGELVPLAEANAHFTKVFATVIERALRIDGEICDALAAETDPVRCRALVDREIRGVLRELKPLVLKTG